MNLSPELIGVIGFIILLVLIFGRVWIGFAMAIVGFGGYLILEGWAKAASMLGGEAYGNMASLSLVTIPLFALMGAAIANTGMGKDLYDSAMKWLGRVRGGLAMASVVACGAFAAVCGFSSAASITVGKIALPEMKRYNYNEDFAAATCVSGGTIGIMIPPSIAFIIFGLLTQLSIGKLFMAGVIPGLLQIVFYCLTIFILVKIHPDWAPKTNVHYTMKEKVSSLKLTGPVLIIFFVVFGGIYFGWFTANEAGAIGSAAALVIAFLAKRLTWENFKAIMLETITTTAMIFTLMTGAYMFQRFITVSNLSFVLANTIQSLGLSKFWFMVCVVILYIILGCIMDIFSAIILTVPVLYPTVTAMGLEPYWFGVICVRVIQMGLITPPIGMDVFTFSGALQLKSGRVFSKVGPFVVADILHLILLLAIPALSLALI